MVQGQLLRVYRLAIQVADDLDHRQVKFIVHGHNLGQVPQVRQFVRADGYGNAQDIGLVIWVGVGGDVGVGEDQAVGGQDDA